MTYPKAVLAVIATLAAPIFVAPARAEQSSAEVVEIPLNPLPFDLKGYLRRPNGTGPFPGIVLVPACSRLGSSADQGWGETLSSWGYVALTLDIFTAHDIPGQTTCL